MINDGDASIEMLFQLSSLQAIVDNVSSLIHHNMVISNREGRIIAATARERIGLTNEEVRRMCEANGDIHIVGQDTKTGFLPGINMTIRYENRPVGAVGVTGNPEEIVEIAHLIQAMVQQQIYDLSLQNSRAERRRIISDFVYSWLYKSSAEQREEYMLRSRTLGLDITVPRVVCIIDSAQDDSPDTVAQRDQLNDRIYQHVENRLAMLDEKNIVIMLNNRVTALLCAKNSDEALVTMTDVQKSIERHFGVRCAIGISSSFHHFESARNRYEVARQACKTSRENRDRTIFVYGPYDLEPLLSTISAEDEQRVYDHFFRNYRSREQLEETIALLDCYIACNRSISQVAAIMNMHKNTVQSRLDRIREMTGYDPRAAADLAYMYVIVLIHKMRRPKHGPLERTGRDRSGARDR